MSDDPRFEALQTGLRQAQDALGGLEDAQRAQDPEGFAQLDSVLDYAALVFERTDPDLLVEPIRQSLISKFGEIASNAPSVAVSPSSHTVQILDWLSKIPPAQDRDWEQAVRDAAANFRRSTSAHLNAVDGDVEKLRAAITEVREELAQAREQAAAAVEQRQAQLDQRVTTAEATVAQTEAQAQALLTEQAAAFDAAEKKRREQASEDWDQTKSDIRTESKELVESLREMRDQAEDLVGAVASATVANKFGEHADKERTAFWWLFAGTVLASLLAVAAAFYAATHPGQEVERFIGKLGLSAIFGGIAAYAGSQAKDRRDGEKEFRRLELELRAFGPFIEPLPEKEKIRERIIMARRTFGRPQTEQEPEAQVDLLSSDDELAERRAGRDAA